MAKKPRHLQLQHSKTVSIGFISDPHGGHLNGLCPSSFFINEEAYPSIAKFQRERWAAYLNIIKDFGGRVDWLFCLGDMTEGKGNRNGACELQWPDLNTQTVIGSRIIKPWRPKEGIVMVYGTPCHTTTNSGEDVEGNIAARVGAVIKDHAFVEVEGVRFDLKHEVSQAETALINARKDAVAWHLQDGQPLADVYVRGHAHRHIERGGDDFGTWRGIVMPGLQGSTRYGARRCQRVIHWGAHLCKVRNGQIVHWETKLFKLFNNPEKLITRDNFAEHLRGQEIGVPNFKEARMVELEEERRKDAEARREQRRQ